jgi:hypothetical protein
MLVVRSDSLPEGPGWAYELKLDGKCPGIVSALADLGDDTVIDGEVVALDEDSLLEHPSASYDATPARNPTVTEASKSAEAGPNRLRDRIGRHFVTLSLGTNHHSTRSRRARASRERKC